MSGVVVEGGHSVTLWQPAALEPAAPLAPADPPEAPATPEAPADPPAAPAEPLEPALPADAPEPLPAEPPLAGL
jgi:hypothetical protein